VWKSTSVSGAPDRCRVDGVEVDAAIQDERTVNLISTQVGGLLLRLPLETQLAVAKDSHWGQELRRFAKQEVTRAAMDDARRKGLPASEAPPPEPVVETEAALYRTAGRFLRAQLQRIAQKGQVDGSGRLAIDPRSLGDADRQLLDMHQRYLGSWQEVVLVIKDDADGAVLCGNQPVI